MKKIIVISCMLLIGNLAFGQKGVDRDPTYSIHNYKHPNKAAYAKEHNLDPVSEFRVELVRRNDNYKQPHNQGVEVKKAVMTARKMDKSTKSYKHPNGL